MFVVKVSLLLIVWNVLKFVCGIRFIIMMWLFLCSVCIVDLNVVCNLVVLKFVLMLSLFVVV